jgi:hypothetical protein
MTVSTGGANTYTYQLSANTSIVQNPVILTAPSVTNAIVSQYTVTGKANTGCWASAVRTLAVMPLPTLSVSISSTAICINQTVQVTATGADSYTWSGAYVSTLNSFKFTAPGTAKTVTFAVTGASPEGCQAAGTISISLKTTVCTGIDEINASSAVTAYPNPFSNELIIGDFTGKAVLYNNLGQAVLTHEPDNSTTLNTSALPAGVYILQTTEASGAQRSFRLLKTN